MMLFALNPSVYVALGLGGLPVKLRASAKRRPRRPCVLTLCCAVSSESKSELEPILAVPTPFYTLQNAVEFPGAEAEHHTPLREQDWHWRFLVSSYGTVARHLFILVSRDRHPLRTRLVSSTILEEGARSNHELIVPSFVRAHVPYPAGWRQVLITSAPALRMRLPGETLFSVASWWSKEALQYARFDDPKPTLLPPLWEAIDADGGRPLVFQVHRIFYGRLPMEAFMAEWDDYDELGQGPRGSNRLAWQRPGSEWGWGRICLYQKKRTIVGVTYEIFSSTLEKYFID